jgi:hypothetical protein
MYNCFMLLFSKINILFFCFALLLCILQNTELAAVVMFTLVLIGIASLAVLVSLDWWGWLLLLV